MLVFRFPQHQILGRALGWLVLEQDVVDLIHDGHLHAVVAGELPSGEAVQAEVSFWSTWLTQFLPFEGMARDQARQRLQSPL